MGLSALTAADFAFFTANHRRKIKSQRSADCDSADVLEKGSFNSIGLASFLLSQDFSTVKPSE